jgi:fructose-1,6-bisphosphatase/inositol monophosphatase family enzyme
MGYMPPISISAIDQIIREVAATEIMPRFRKLAAGDVTMKGVNDPVTIADQESERCLTERFTDYLPGSVVVGEEGVSKDKSTLRHLAGENAVWIIDPIDGTRNFVAGTPEFAVMVALLHEGQPVAAWIHDPNSGDTIMGEQGAGVWLRGKRLRLAAADPSIPTVGLVGARVKKLIADPAVMPQGGDFPKIEIGSCAGFDYPRLFTGEVSFANATTPRAGFLFYRHTNVWDHAPGLFLHREGGGYSANWAGKPYEMADPLGGLLFAANRDEWMRLHYLFRPLMSHIVKNAVWEF